MALGIIIVFVFAVAATVLWTVHGAKGSGAVLSMPTRMTVTPDKHPKSCPSAKQAVKFYRSRVSYWLDKMGTASGGLSTLRPSTGCPRYLAGVLQRKAAVLRERYLTWVEYHWHWWKWMPSKWQRIGACETGYGKRPGNFDHDSGTYVSFAGIIRSGYDSFARSLGLPTWAGNPTPRQQLLVAQSLQSRYGYGAWGCGGA